MNRTILLSVIHLFLLSASVTKGQNNLIPNTSDCAGTRPSFAFNIHQAWSVSGISNFCSPLAGDLDGDGKTEVIAMGSSGNIYIYDGKTGALAGSISTGRLASYITNPYAICDIEGDGKAEIFVVSSSSATATLYKITSGTGNRPITFTTAWSTNLPSTISSYASHGVIPAVADLNGDGSPEFVAAHYIIDKNGTLKATMNYGGGILGPGDLMSVSYIADLDKDSIPEIIVGTDVYKYNGTTATLWKRCPSIPAGADGTNMAADINLDGNVDLVYHDTRNKGTGTIVVWTPVLSPAAGTSSTVGIIGTIPNLQSGYRCYPVIGDIDGIVSAGNKRYPEICYNAQNHMYAYSFNGTSFTQKWNMTTNEVTGVATFTFFDFNLDGIVELVYRDETTLKVMDCQGSSPNVLYSMPATSATVIETPIVADVTGDGSADIIVTGSYNLYVFEGAASKWAACPNVWNQQMYSPLLINTDLTVFQKVVSPNLTFHLSNGDSALYYNGGPMQVPYISEESFLPIDLSPDLYVVSGTIEIISQTSVKLTVTFGNQGLMTASASSPIRYYKNSMTSGNILGSETLGVDLAPGQTHTITKTLSNLGAPMPSQFYVRILDDGTNFPALGTYSDCNLTNNHKSFGTLELLKTANSLNACVDGTIIFNIRLVNNTAQTNSPQTFYNLVLVDSLGTGWEYLSANTNDGTLSAYNSTTREIQWRLDSIADNDTVELIITAKAINAGAIRNTIWIDSINNMLIGREMIEAYVIVNSVHAPIAAIISPDSINICTGDSILLTSSISSASSYQWFKDNIELPNDTLSTCWAKTPGHYTVTYFDVLCVSQMSDAAVITNNHATETMINISGSTVVCKDKNTNLTVTSLGVSSPVYKWYSSQTATTPFYTGNSYTTSALTADTTFYVSVSGSNYCENIQGNRKAVTLTILPPLIGGTIGNSQSYCYGIMPLIYLGVLPASGGSGNTSNYTYQWESSTDGNTWNDLGISTQNHSVSSLTQTTYYRRGVTDICETVYSNTIQITINPLPLVSAGRTDLCIGLTTKLIPDTGGVWTSSDSSVVDIINNKTIEGKSSGTATLTYTSSSTGCSENITITVNDYPTVVDEITGNKMVCLGETVQLSNTTSGGVWMHNNSNVSLDNPNANPVTVTGRSLGKSYVTYTVSDINGICQTKRTFQLKIIPNTPPKIYIG
ncbi:MAG: FG-GAP-like repeat-containing protein, partial [Bacteroidales bacterium]|nr:FG-GAP-like repeat-containing protein [Bacteroidales bacterium]